MRSGFPAESTGGVTDEAKDVTTGRAAAEPTAAEETVASAASPSRCWMEWSWKQGSESRTEAAREILGGDREEEGRHTQQKNINNRSWTHCQRRQVVQDVQCRNTAPAAEPSGSASSCCSHSVQPLGSCSAVSHHDNHTSSRAQ